jgi:hypothetical protein
MKITITAHGALQRGIWDDLCDMKGWNVYAINEGLMDSDDEIELSAEEATKLGLIKEVSNA